MDLSSHSCSQKFQPRPDSVVRWNPTFPPMLCSNTSTLRQRKREGQAIAIQNRVMLLQQSRTSGCFPSNQKWLALSSSDIYRTFMKSKQNWSWPKGPFLQKFTCSAPSWQSPIAPTLGGEEKRGGLWCSCRTVIRPITGLPGLIWCPDKHGIHASHLSTGQWGQRLKIIISNEWIYNDSLVVWRRIIT